MKKILLLLSIIAVCGCGKDDAEDAIDCFGDALFVDAHHAASAENPLIINFNVSYSGSNSLNNSIQWDFGDGTVQTVSGVNASHTYTQAGSYHAKAYVTVSVGGGTCTHEVRETVNINP